MDQSLIGAAVGTRVGGTFRPVTPCRGVRYGCCSGVLQKIDRNKSLLFDVYSSLRKQLRTAQGNGRRSERGVSEQIQRYRTSCAAGHRVWGWVFGISTDPDALYSRKLWAVRPLSRSRAGRTFLGTDLLCRSPSL